MERKKWWMPDCAPYSCTGEIGIALWARHRASIRVHARNRSFTVGITSKKPTSAMQRSIVATRTKSVTSLRIFDSCCVQVWKLGGCRNGYFKGNEGQEYTGNARVKCITVCNFGFRQRRFSSNRVRKVAKRLQNKPELLVYQTINSNLIFQVAGFGLAT